MIDPRSLALAVPVMAAPMFLVSGPELVIAQCRAGVIGSFPALNARPTAQLDEWLGEIGEACAPASNGGRILPPFAVNLIVHASNNRLDADLALLAKHRVPIVITSLGARADVFAAVREWGGFAFHDVVNQRFAHKAVEKGAQGLILVAAGAGGHAGTQSPFALAAETRRWFDGPLALAGAISSGRAIRAARMLGADFAYIGSPFIPTNEALASPGHKAMVAECHAGDIVYTDAFSGVHGNYLVPSIRKAGLDPMALPTAGAMSFRSDGNAGLSERKVWKDIWGSGQGIGAIDEVVPAGQLVDRLAREYREAV